MMNMLSAVKQTCKMQHFVSVLFLYIFVHLFCLYLQLFFCFVYQCVSGQNGTISLWLYFTSLPFNGDVVKSFECSFSQIHALKICMHKLIQSELAIHPYWGPSSNLGRLRKSGSKLKLIQKSKCHLLLSLNCKLNQVAQVDKWCSC